MGVEEEINALLVLISDEDVDVAQAARERLLELGESFVPILKKRLDKLPFSARLRVRQIINIIEVTSQRKSVSPYINPARWQTRAG